MALALRFALAVAVLSLGACGKRVERPYGYGAGVYPDQVPPADSNLEERVAIAAGATYQAPGDERPLDERPSIAARVRDLKRAVRDRSWGLARELADELEAELERYRQGLAAAQAEISKRSPGGDS